MTTYNFRVSRGISRPLTAARYQWQWGDPLQQVALDSKSEHFLSCEGDIVLSMAPLASYVESVATGEGLSLLCDTDTGIKSIHSVSLRFPEALMVAVDVVAGIFEEKPPRQTGSSGDSTSSSITIT